MPDKGESAPSFTMPSTRGALTLQGLLEKGKLVLAFYVEDATPT